MNGETPNSALGALECCLEAYLGQLKYAFEKRDEGCFVLPLGNPEDPVLVWVSAHEWTDDHTLVQVMSVVSEELRLEPHPDVLIADENSRLLFGKLVVDPEELEVRFEHPLVGDFLGRDELDMAIRVVGDASAKYRVVLADRFGLG